jgi:hypothetical protein
LSAKKTAPTRAGNSAKRGAGKPFQPGNEHAWKPGQSGNPAGRPRDQAESAAYIARRLREEFLDQAIDALKFHAVKGSAPHMIEALNRVAGRVLQELEVGGQAVIGVVVLPPEDET